MNAACAVAKLARVVRAGSSLAPFLSDGFDGGRGGGVR